MASFKRCAGLPQSAVMLRNANYIGACVIALPGSAILPQARLHRVRHVGGLSPGAHDIYLHKRFDTAPGRGTAATRAGEPPACSSPFSPRDNMELEND
jgi:hypothetical protein